MIEWWAFPIGVMAGYVGLVVGFYLLDRWRADRVRDKRVDEWVQMVREQRQERSDSTDRWATRTWRERDKKE